MLNIIVYFNVPLLKAKVLISDKKLMSCIVTLVLHNILSMVILYEAQYVKYFSFHYITFHQVSAVTVSYHPRFLKVSLSILRYP